jgi:hypothetical protein
MTGADYSYECGCYWFSGNVVACEKHRPHMEVGKVAKREHGWEFYANGSFCKKCGAAIVSSVSGVPCR